MQYTATTVAGTVRFRYRTRIGNFIIPWARFSFSVDGVEVMSTTNDRDWVEHTHPVAAGTHTFTWTFLNIDLLNFFNNGAWIDDISIPDKPPHQVKPETMAIKGTSDNPINWATAWANAGNLLTYDVQTKISWGYQLQYGGNGINFRWQPHPNYTTAPNKKYQGYGYSTIYHRGLCQGDYIPDGIKPPGTENLPLLVLWKQTVSDAGAITKEWLAYKRIPAGDYALGGQRAGDGLRFNDNMSMFVRIIEARDVRGIKYNDIMAFYGDASLNATRLTTLLGNTNPFDGNRKVYNPSIVAGSPGYVWPVVFTPLNLAAQWIQAYDYMTLVQWDQINGSASGGVNLQSNGYVIRDSSFTTPSSGSFPTPSVYGGDEVALHVFADATWCASGTFNVIAFRDFGINIYSPQP
jgi:hypothetical protein